VNGNKCVGYQLKRLYAEYDDRKIKRDRGWNYGGLNY
jgi:hypothetical protein